MCRRCEGGGVGRIRVSVLLLETICTFATASICEGVVGCWKRVRGRCVDVGARLTAYGGWRAW